MESLLKPKSAFLKNNSFEISGPLWEVNSRAFLNFAIESGSKSELVKTPSIAHILLEYYFFCFSVGRVQVFLRQFAIITEIAFDYFPGFPRYDEKIFTVFVKLVFAHVFFNLFKISSFGNMTWEIEFLQKIVLPLPDRPVDQTHD